MKDRHKFAPILVDMIEAELFNKFIQTLKGKKIKIIDSFIPEKHGVVWVEYEIVTDSTVTK